MTECTQLSDRMAAVAHGRSEWSAEEAAHLESCQDCGAEWRVMRAGALLGMEVARTLPAEFVATRVVAAVKAPRSARGWWPRLRWLAVPAAAAAVALLALPDGRGPAAPGAGTVEVGVLPELEPLDATALEAVLELLPSQDTPVEIRGFDELSD